MRLRLDRLGLTERLLVFLLPMISLTLVLMAWIAISGSRAVVDRFASQYGREIATSELSTLATLLRSIFDPVRGLETTILSMDKVGNHDRKVVSEWAKEWPSHNPALLAVWFFAEPNAFGRDADYLTGNLALGAPNTGRFLTYWARDEEGIMRFSPAPPDFEQQDYYAKPKRSGRPGLTQLYTYPVLGIDRRMVSYVVPVVSGGRFLGVVGGDIDFSELRPWFESRHPLGGRVLMKNGTGNWAYHSDNALIGKPIAADDRLTEWEERNLAANIPYTLDKVDEQGQRFRRFVVPAPYTEDDVGRMMLVDIPIDALLAPFGGISQAILLTGIIAALLAAVWTAVSVRLVVGAPLDRLRRAIARIDQGSLAEAVPDTVREDEVGGIARALESFRLSEVDRRSLRASLDKHIRELERMAAGINAAKDAVAALDPQMNIIYANQATHRMLGAPEGTDLAGRNWRDLLDSSLVNRTAGAWDEFGRQLDAAGHWSVEVENWRSVFGKHIPIVDVTASKMPNNDILVVWRDISEARSAQHELERLATGITAALDAIVMLDADRRVVFANPATHRLIGAPPDAKFIGRRWDELLDYDGTEERARIRADFSQQLTKHQHWTAEAFDLRTEFGAHIQCAEISGTRMGNDVLLWIRDVSDAKRTRQERDQLQLQLLQQDKMEAIGRMAGGIAHDFNNLLGAMLGYIEFLTMDLKPGTRELDYAQRLSRIADRAKDLVRQILAFSRADAEAMGPLSLRSVLEEAQAILRSMVPASTQLSWQIDPGSRDVQGNPTQVVQLLMNLIMNASDSCGGAGAVGVRVRNGEGWNADEKGRPERVIQSFDLTTPHVAVEIEDTGHGMTEAVMDRLFEPFFTTKAKGKGTGLGMPVVYGIVRAHSGGLVVASAPGAGTLIRVLLPVAEQVPAKAERAVAASSGHQGLHILVVDDERDMGDMLVEGLTRRGHEVVQCENASEALEAIGEDPDAFQIVVTDQTMPGMTGVELIQHIKRQWPALRCVLYTGYSERTDERVALAEGADAFFYKPVVVAELAAALERLARKPASTAQPAAAASR